MSMKFIIGITFLLCCLLGLPTKADPMRTGLVYHSDYLLHDPGAGHPERPARLEAIVSRLQQHGLVDALISVDAQPVDDSWLAQVHTKAYLERLDASAKDAPLYLDPDTGLSKESVRVAKLASGGVLAAVDAVMSGTVNNAFVAQRPPGHHALPDRAMGFCLINHVAVAARYVQQKYGLKRVLIVDWDVHHGNGTEHMFYADPSVFYFSTHQSPYYPGTGAATDTGSGAGVGTTLNVPVPAGTGDTDIVHIFENRLVPAMDDFQPEFVLISAGFDAHRDDPLASLELSEAGYRELTQIVMAIAAKFADGRIVSLLEGGYDLDALASSVEAHVRTLTGQPDKTN